MTADELNEIYGAVISPDARVFVPEVCRQQALQSVPGVVGRGGLTLI